MASPEFHRTLVHTESPQAREVVDREVVASPVNNDIHRTVSADRVSSFARITPARVITAAGAVIFLVIGLTALARGGLGGPLDEPVVKVAGFTQTPLLGLLGAGFGLVFLLISIFGSDAGSRSAGTFFGALLAIGGIVAIVAPENLRSLAIQSSYGWMALIVGGAIVLANVALPTITRSSVTYR